MDEADQSFLAHGSARHQRADCFLQWYFEPLSVYPLARLSSEAWRTEGPHCQFSQMPTNNPRGNPLHAVTGRDCRQRYLSLLLRYVLAALSSALPRELLHVIEQVVGDH